MQNLSYTYDEYLICIGLGPGISSVICKNLSYSGPSYPSSELSDYNSGTCFLPELLLQFWDVPELFVNYFPIACLMTQ